MEHLNLIEISSRLARSGIGTDNWGPAISRLVGSVWRHLAEEGPLAQGALERLRRHAGLSEQTCLEFLERYRAKIDYDANRRIIRWFGLSIPPTSYPFQLGNRVLHAWCAWDILFLTPILGQPVGVESVCPTTGEAIQIDIDPTGVQGYRPGTAALSIVIPEQEVLGLASAEAARCAFCYQVHFFSSPEAARSWFHERDEPPLILTLEEGFELGALRYGEVLQHV